MSLSPDVTGRLAFIRYLHYLGIEQTRLPEPQNAAAVLSFHDAVEAFLLLAAEHLGTSAPREFMQYWDMLSPEKLTGGVDLTMKQGMTRLNRVRVALKHNGVIPGSKAISKLAEDTAVFFSANTQLVFGVAYDQVSMVDVIAQDRVRNLARTAETAAATGDYTAAMVALTDAAHLLLSPRRSTTRLRISPLRFGESLSGAFLGQDLQNALEPPPGSKARGHDPNKIARRNMARTLENLTDIVTKLQAAARVTTLGVDYAAYLRFLSLTPRADDYMQGRREYSAPKGYAPTSDDFAFCLQFVITTSLRLTEVHAHLQPPEWSATGSTGGPVWEKIATGKTPGEGYL